MVARAHSRPLDILHERPDILTMGLVIVATLLLGACYWHSMLVEGRPFTDTKCFRAAVYQHERRDTRDCRSSAETNLRIYERVARIASKNKASIIVYPEDGLFAGSNRYLLPCLNEIADPDEPMHQRAPANPCLDPDDHNESSFIMKRLSCIAKENNLYVVANFGTRQNCIPKTRVGEDICLDTGYFMLNTNVVFDPSGNFIKRYRKYNKFIEQFNKAPSIELVHFDTPIGRFGLFTCFDALYKSPAVDLVEKYHIDTALFPTWWFDMLPIHSAIQYQDAWSLGNRVNLLAANLLAPQRGSVGCGIYSLGNNSVYVGANDLRPKLILANLPSNARANEQCQKNFNELVLDVEYDDEETMSNWHYKPRGHHTITKNDTVLALRKNEAKVEACLEQVCCHLDYKLVESTGADMLSKLILVVKNGLSAEFNWYEQACFLATTDSPFVSELTTRVRYDWRVGANFERLSMVANFSTKYVYPVANQNVSKLVDRRDRKFNCNQLREQQFSCAHELIIAKQNLSSAIGAQINSFGFFARLFEKDAKRSLGR